MPIDALKIRQLCYDGIAAVKRNYPAMAEEAFLRIKAELKRSAAEPDVPELSKDDFEICANAVQVQADLARGEAKRCREYGNCSTADHYEQAAIVHEARVARLRAAAAAITP